MCRSGDGTKELVLDRVKVNGVSREGWDKLELDEKRFVLNKVAFASTEKRFVLKEVAFALTEMRFTRTRMALKLKRV